MEQDDIDFIEKLVLRFMHVYPVGQDSGRDIDNLCGYLTNLCPALSYVTFKKDLQSILEGLIKQNLLYTQDVQQLSPQKKIACHYYISEAGKASAKTINDEAIINIVLDVWIKDITFRNWVIHRFLPFQRFSEYELSERVREVMYYYDQPYDIEKAMRKAIFYDSYSFGRLFDLLKRGGFIREFEKDKYKFTKRGKKLIEIGNYDDFVFWENEQKKINAERERRNDLLAESNLSNGKIQQSLLSINRWIAVSAIVAIFYYFHEVLKVYKNLDVYSGLILLVFGGIIGSLILLLIQDLMGGKRE